MIDITGKPANKAVTQVFNAHDNLFTAIKVAELAKQLGFAIVQRDDGMEWIQFVKDGKPVTNVSFYHPSHAYAFLLGVASTQPTAQL